MKKIELLAPCGSFDALKAAVENGADAVYLGGKQFSARAYALNFTNEEIVEAIKYAHLKDVSVYVSINTLIRQEDLNQVFEYIDFLYLNDVDGLIIYDLGLLSVLKQRYPNLRIHASTQINTDNLWSIKMLESLNIDRVVLARETDLKTIKYLKENSNIEIEVFAHGALCVCYSGNCLHSSLLGKRSGNQGSCAQPCRMQYGLLENNAPITAKEFLLSMKDLNTLEILDKLIEANITSLKIEGRMKNPEYVAFVVKTYRQAIDNYYQSHKTNLDSDDLLTLGQLYSRDFTTGYINNESNNNLTNVNRSSHIGKKIGKVIYARDNIVRIKVDVEVQQKDKLAILQKDEIQFHLNKIKVKERLVNKAYKNEIMEIELNSPVVVNSEVYMLVDNSLNEEIRATYENNNKRIPLKMRLFAHCDNKLTLLVKDNNNNAVKAESEYIVCHALTSPTSDEKIKEQIEKLGQSVYYCKNLFIESDENIMIPVKVLNELRREVVEKLNAIRSLRYNRQKEDINELKVPFIKPKKLTQSIAIEVNDLFKLETILKNSTLKIDRIYYSDVKTYDKARQLYPSENIYLSLPRIKDDNLTASSKTYVASNLGDVYAFHNNRMTTSIYLGVSNVLTVEYLLSLGVEYVALSCELNRKQIKDIQDEFVKRHNFLPPLELFVYGRVQTMVTKHCFISKELGFKNKFCKACFGKEYSLVDRYNYVFPIAKDDKCNLIIYNSKIIYLLDQIERIKELEINHLLLSFTFESEREIDEVINSYLIDNHQNKPLGITYGYFNDEN